MQLLTNHNQRKRQPSARHGSVTVIVLVVLLIMTAMVGQYARRVIHDRRQVRQQLLHRQTLELATAGVQRLKQQRQADPTWSGETWKPTIGDIDQTNEAEVVITVDGDSATIVARYPIDSQFPIQITRQIELEE
jgi:type II secretory pathway pseudopilin PulG